MFLSISPYKRVQTSSNYFQTFHHVSTFQLCSVCGSSQRGTMLRLQPCKLLRVIRSGLPCSTCYSWRSVLEMAMRSDRRISRQATGFTYKNFYLEILSSNFILELNHFDKIISKYKFFKYAIGQLQ